MCNKLEVLKDHYKQCYQNFQYADAEHVRKAALELEVARQILSQEFKNNKKKGAN
jgi:hypothetical protein